MNLSSKQFFASEQTFYSRKAKVKSWGGRKIAWERPQRFLWVHELEKASKWQQISIWLVNSSTQKRREELFISPGPWREPIYILLRNLWSEKQWSECDGNSVISILCKSPSPSLVRRWILQGSSAESQRPLHSASSVHNAMKHANNFIFRWWEKF